jgi:plasmid stabilization system protein ParE
MTLIYLEEARRELLEAVAYYERCGEGLGGRFFNEVQAGEDAILRMPEAWGKLHGAFRRKLLQRFPYGLIYRVLGKGTIEVVAVAHLHRQPNYWLSRKQG